MFYCPTFDLWFELVGLKIGAFFAFNFSYSFAFTTAANVFGRFLLKSVFFSSFKPDDDFSWDPLASSSFALTESAFSLI
jgi:hypothetical protein